MRAVCSNAAGLVDRLVELPCPLRATMQGPKSSSCSLLTNSVSMLLMPADWTTPGGSNPEHRCTPPISMLKACGRHFRRHVANARPIGLLCPKAPATSPIRRERRLRQSPQCVGQGLWPSPLTATRTFFCGDMPISVTSYARSRSRSFRHHSIVMRLVMRGEPACSDRVAQAYVADRLRQDAAGSPLAEAEFQDRCIKPLGHLPR